MFTFALLSVIFKAPVAPAGDKITPASLEIFHLNLNGSVTLSQLNVAVGFNGKGRQRAALGNKPI